MKLISIVHTYAAIMTASSFSSLIAPPLRVDRRTLFLSSGCIEQHIRLSTACDETIVAIAISTSTRSNIRVLPAYLLYCQQSLPVRSLLKSRA